MEKKRYMDHQFITVKVLHMKPTLDILTRNIKTSMFSQFGNWLCKHKQKEMGRYEGKVRRHIESRKGQDNKDYLHTQGQKGTNRDDTVDETNKK